MDPTPEPIEYSLSPDELVDRHLARVEWRRSRSTAPRPPSRVISVWEEWIGSDPERAWPLFEAFVRRCADDDGMLEQVWFRLKYLLSRHGRAFEARVRALVASSARLQRIVPAAELDPAAHRPRPLDVPELVQAYITQSVHFADAHQLDEAIREEPERGLRLALEIISRGPLHGFKSFDTFSPLCDLLRMHGHAAIAEIEEAAAGSVLVRRALAQVGDQQSHPPSPFDVPLDVWLRAERAMAGTTDYNTDDPPGIAHPLPPDDERVVDSWFIREEAFWAWERVGDIVENDPQLAWRVILLLIGDAPSDEVLGSVAAGPLEDFLRLHCEHFIEHVEARARTDDRFRMALQGVWKTEMSDALWARVQAAANGD
jgi:hypothetical protein